MVAPSERPAAEGGSDRHAAVADEGERPEHPAPPAVVAVVVTHDPGPWFDEALRSLRDQDYPAVSVLVVDTASADDPTPGIASVLPSAYVRRLDHDPGFANAANEVLHVVEGAAFYLFCHDDVALAPDAVRAMVEEAFRSNAGVVAPKVVEWDEPTRILSVGQTVDKTGVRAPLVERGELDQEQHDAVRDVFVAPSGCTLVRADLFSVLKGFDRGIDAIGEDLDLSWRAQVAGARVIAAPAAVVRHLERSATDRPVTNRRERTIRHRVRTMLTSYGTWHRVRVLPQAIALTLVEIVYAALAGRRDLARDHVTAWRWNFAHRDAVKANRAALEAVRQLPDAEVRRLQVRGSARLGGFLRGQLGGAHDDRLQTVTSAGRDLAASLTTGRLRLVAATWTGIVVVLLVGSRSLVYGKLPALVDYPLFPSRPWTLFTEWFSGWRNAGLGSESPAPTAFAFLGSLGVLFLGAMSVLRRVLFLAPLPLGVVGAWRLTRPIESTRGRLVGLVTYLAIPLPYNAIARGRWGGLVLWAVAPWIVRTLAHVGDAEPFTASGRARRRTVVALALSLAVVGAFVPIAIFVVPVVAVALALGGLVAGQRRGSGSAIGVAFAAAGLAVVLHVPWALDFVLPGSQWSAVAGVQSTSAPLDAGALLRFQTGPWGGGAIGLAFLVVAALPLLIGREWRLRWAVRAWVVALVCWTVAWCAQQSWFGHALGPPEAFLAPAAVALATCAALGVAAFEIDLPGYRFGWRQVASVVAAVALTFGLLPVAGAMFEGRWNAPDESFQSILAFLGNEQRAAGPFRVVWIGDPDVLPLAGWQLRDGVAYATTDGGLPRVENRWAGSSEGATSLIADAFALAEGRETSRLGRLLGPMGVRYVVVAGQAAPGSGDRRPLPAGVERALSEQLDLEEVLADPGLHVYRNVSWVPLQSALSGPAAAAVDRTPFFDAAAAADLTGAAPALTDHGGYASARGHVDKGSTVYLGSASSDRWSLSVDGHAVARGKAFGWANAFAVDRDGTATLKFATPASRYLLLLVQVALWVYAISRLRAWRKEEGQ